MASRFAASALRSARASGSTASASGAFRNAAKRTVQRRGMSSTAESAPKAKSDTPWIIGSTVVFGPAIVYLVSPSSPAAKAKKAAAAHAHGHGNKEPAKVELADDEGTKADVTETLAASEKEDSPQSDSADSESFVKVELTDDEGKKEDVTSSLAAAEAEDSPKSAQAEGKSPSPASPLEEYDASKVKESDSAKKD